MEMRPEGRVLLVVEAAERWKVVEVRAEPQVRTGAVYPHCTVVSVPHPIRTNMLHTLGGGVPVAVVTQTTAGSRLHCIERNRWWGSVVT